MAAATRGVGDNHYLQLGLAWSAVGLPLAWGVYRTLQSAARLFN
ncbi:MAG: MFS transporter small subunit [Steroidobacteraceae bacterium]